MATKVASLVAEISADTSKLNRGLKQAEGATKSLSGKMQSGLGDAGDSVTGLSDKLSSFQASVLPAIGVLAGFGMAAKEAFEFAEAGANLERMAQAGDRLAASLGGNMDEIIAKISAAGQGAVANSDIIASANRAMMLGLGADADQLASLMEVAAHRAKAMGLDTTTAFNDIVTGVGRGSAMILDNLGIIVDSKAVYEEYAASIGKSAGALTAMEKKQALLNSVLAEGQAQIEAAGGSAADSATAFEVLRANIKNATDEAKVAASVWGERFAVGLNAVLFGAQQVDAAFSAHSATVLETSQSYEEYSAELMRAATAAGRIVDSQGQLVTIHGQVADANYMLSDSLYNASQAQDGWLTGIESGVKFNEGGAIAARVHAERIDELARRQDEGIEPAERAANSYDLVRERNEAAAAAAAAHASKIKELGSAFMDGIPSQEDFYRMMLETERAQGASIEQLGSMAQAMGVATNAEVQAQLAMYGMVDAFNAGTLSVHDMASASALMERHATQAALAEELGAEAAAEAALGHSAAAAELQEQANQAQAVAENSLAAALQIAEVGVTAEQTVPSADELTNSMDRSKAALERAGNAAGYVQDKLSAIERNIEVNIRVRERWERTGYGGPGGAGAQESYQTGTSYVPDTGLYMLHRGEAVIPAAQNVGGRGGGTTWTGNIIVQGAGNPEATAAVVMRKLQDRGIMPVTNYR